MPLVAPIMVIAAAIHARRIHHPPRRATTVPEVRVTAIVVISGQLWSWWCAGHTTERFLLSWRFVRCAQILDPDETRRARVP